MSIAYFLGSINGEPVCHHIVEYELNEDGNAVPQRLLASTTTEESARAASRLMGEENPTVICAP